MIDSIIVLSYCTYVVCRARQLESARPQDLTNRLSNKSFVNLLHSISTKEPGDCAPSPSIKQEAYRNHKPSSHLQAIHSIPASHRHHCSRREISFPLSKAPLWLARCKFTVPADERRCESPFGPNLRDLLAWNASYAGFAIVGVDGYAPSCICAYHGS